MSLFEKHRAVFAPYMTEDGKVKPGHEARCLILAQALGFMEAAERLKGRANPIVEKLLRGERDGEGSK